MWNKAEGLVACLEMQKHFPSAGCYNDDTQSHRLPGVQFWVGSSRIGRSSWESLNTGRHEKAPVRCPCNRLAALRDDPQMPLMLSL